MINIKSNKVFFSTLALIMITIWSAMQYQVESYVPESISSFAFLFITNLIGCILLAAFQLKRLKKIKRSTVLKASVLGVIQLGVNAFIILGSNNVNSDLASGILSLYFIFVTPILLIMRQKVSFRSGVATVVALIALILAFNTSIEAIAFSKNVVYLIAAGILLAGYVAAVSVFTVNEASGSMAFVQLAVCAILSLAAWFVESKIYGLSTMSLTAEPSFWISALFIGIFMRALYSLIQISAQKNVHPVCASLILASNTIISLVLNPIMFRLFGSEYQPATKFQIAGCVLFVIAVLVCDDVFMRRFHYNDMDTTIVYDKDGNMYHQVPLSRKIVNMNLIIGLGALVVSTVICMFSIFTIRSTVIETSQSFGKDAAKESQKALIVNSESELQRKATDKSAVATEKLGGYQSTAQYAAKLAAHYLSEPDNYKKLPVSFPSIENSGIWTMQMTLADESIDYESVKTQNEALGNMESMFSSIHERNPELTTVYVGTEEGLMIAYDPNSYSEESGALEYYEFRDSEWYKNAKETGSIGFTDTYLDATNRGLTITCYSPIYDEEGIFLGVVGLDFLQNDLNEQLVSVGITGNEIAVLVSGTGSIIAVTGREAGEEAVTIADESSNLPLTLVSGVILARKSGMIVATSGKDTYYVSFATVESTGWKLCIISPREDIIAPSVKITDSIETNTEKINATVSEGVHNIIAMCLIFFAVIVVIITYYVGRLSDKITQPLKQLQKDVSIISEGDFSQRTAVNTSDEIGSLARAFNEMTASLQHYITDLTEATAREERISSELSFATKIQADALPRKYPAFPDRDEFDVFFTMQPAKEVGGDFYDFFFIDDSHLAIMVSDVSGKGVPAAMFMMESKMIIKNRAMVGGMPSEILAFANNQLCESNEVEMFVTVWLGILDLKTGILTAANAGHEFPILRHGEGAFELVKDRHGFVVAGMENSKYHDYTLQLGPDDMLFLYTDGVPEATDAENRLFGTDRLLASLNSNRNGDCKEKIESLLADISAFVGDAPQFDDITMVCLHLKKLM